MSKLTNIKHIFFDLDHTLWDFDKNSELAFKHIFEKNNIAVPLHEFLEVYKPINFRYWKYYRESKITKEKLRYGRLSNSFSSLGFGIDKHMIDKLSEDYITHLPDNNHLFEGTYDLLSELSKNYNLHIITNGFEEVQHLKLKRSKIDCFFQTITTSESVGVKKPDPRIFNFALAQAGASIENSLMIGDTYEADILGARALGIETILFNYHLAEAQEGDRVVMRLLEILEHI
ncbi:YjjG family noncanonical pyrimidine nucleotidase [Flavimarina sp. Hel_I_48]|uniref:YjjG family noncanonical pyrimidine nucleotidase n=1 Tax=Flavimarina sp. Hel_I_48 TaxID=1392488 RepID=UPI00068CA83B|nr:YjjG family noncanonical pyrimidine nucleotidase [Flavimarina sp. Hel_I_48]